MKKLLILIAFTPLLLWAQTEGFKITGKIAGLSDGQVRLTTTQQDNLTVATGSIKSGELNISGSVPEPGLYYLVLGNQPPQYIFLENKPIRITGSKSDIKNLNIEGSQSHKDFLEFNKTFNPLVATLNKCAAQLQQQTNEKKREALLKQFDSINGELNNQVGKFVSSRRDSYVSPFVLFVTSQLNDNPALLEQRYNMLDENIKNSRIGKSLAEFIAYNKIGAVGSNAMDFTQNDVNGNPIALSSFKGKYVLVDFWASWCRPCRAENPNVVKAYNKFKDKNFTILSVSLDQDKDSWTKAIEKDGLKWNHVSDLKYWSNAVAVQYHIQSIPQNFLIDPNGKIVAKDLRGADLERKLCELLGCN
jgi:peroxiredoxin